MLDCMESGLVIFALLCVMINSLSILLTTAIGVVRWFAVLAGCLIQIHKGVLKKCPLKNDLKPTGSKAVPKKPKK